MDKPVQDPHAARRLEHFVDCQIAIDTLFHEAAESQDGLAAMERFLGKAAAFSGLPAIFAFDPALHDAKDRGRARSHIRLSSTSTGIAL